ncbi:MAG: ABC transporter permease [Lachnospiraceae bacterium]|nr:ABC transporter permease [Lachnospiraceae bacterium]
MLIGENILLALNGLRANKMRSLLTMLGIIIGIASVIAIMTLGDSISKSVEDSMSSMGVNNITMGVSQKSTTTETTASGMTFSRGPRMAQLSEEDYINEEMLTDLLERYPEQITGFSLQESIGSGTIQKGSATASISAVGVNAENLESADLTLLAGRTLTERDQSEARRVALVSEHMVKNVFGTANVDVIGQTIDVLFHERYYTYTIVGVYEYEESEMGFSTSSSEETQTMLYLPLRTAREQTHNRKGYSQLTVLTSPETDTVSFCTTLETYMNSRYYSKNESFEIRTMSLESVIESMTEMLSSVSLAIAAIAAISLLVGGIGVMNIMLVSITERTREIGTRKALGAPNSSIRLQFITEAIVLCVIGGVLGILLGVGIAAIATNAMGYAVSPSVDGILLSVSFSAFIGVFFGYYPANKAAKLNPIEALRYE